MYLSILEENTYAPTHGSRTKEDIDGILIIAISNIIIMKFGNVFLLS